MISLNTLPAVGCLDLTVRYGRTLALDGVTLSVETGQVYALLGRNGSGKSSLVRCLLGHQKPDHGVLSLLGTSVWPNRASLMGRVGVVTEEPDAPPAMTARQLLQFCADLHPAWDGEAADARLARFRMPLDVPFGRLSRGQKAQLSLALALGPRPQVLVLDDPTLGLDAVARREVYEELLAELAERGTTVFLTTHDLAGIEGIADRVGILHEGRLLVDAPLEDLKGAWRRVTWAPCGALARDLLSACAPVAVREGGLGGEAVLRTEALERLKSDGPPGIEGHALALEELFVALVGPEREVQP